MNAIASDLKRLIEVAQSASGSDLQAFLHLFADIFQGEYPHLPAEQRDLCDQILLDIFPKVSLDQRVALAESLASNAHVSHRLILNLAMDHMAVALPVLERSPSLTEEDFLAIIDVAGPDQHQAISERADLSPSVTSALIQEGNAYTLKTLVHNHSAPLSDGGLEHLLSYAKEDVTLRHPLLERPDLPKEAALRIATWSSEAIRNFVVTKYDRFPDAPDAAPTTERSAPTECHQTPSTDDKERLGRLIADGRLKPPFLIRALHRRDADTFFHAFATLMDVADTHAERILDTTSPTPMALACRAIGATRPQFDTLYILLRRLRDSSPKVGNSERQQIDQIFKHLSPEKALSAIHAMV